MDIKKGLEVGLKATYQVRKSSALKDESPKALCLGHEDY